MPEYPSHKPFVFLVGCERSGTTLLRAILSAHSELAIPGESYFIIEMLRCRSRYEREGHLNQERFVNDLSAHRWFARWSLPVTHIERALERRRPRDVPGALRAVFEAYAESQGKARYGDKTPRYVLELPLLAESFPEARFIHIIRDGRDVALSLVERTHRRPNSVGEAAMFYRRAVSLGRRAGRTLGSRYMEVCYEQLVETPATVTSQICEFVGLEYEDRMLRYYDDADAIVASFDRPEFHHNLFRPPSPKLRDWRSAMTAHQQHLFEVIAGPLLRDLGYETHCRHPSSAYAQGALAAAGYAARLAPRGATRFASAWTVRRRSGEQLTGRAKRGLKTSSMLGQDGLR